MYEAAMKIENRILRAAFVARIAHINQRRKYNNVPYVTHPARVAAMVSIHLEGDEDMVCAGYLHDTIEDTWVDFQLLSELLGPSVANLVQELTNPSHGSPENRRTRKQKDLEHLKTVSHKAKILKLIDRLDNLLEMQGADTDFKRKYAIESKALVETIGDADTELAERINKVIAEILK